MFVQLQFKALVNSLSVLRRELQIFFVFLLVSFLMISRLPVICSYILGATFKATISIYAQDKLSPLPSLEEILICNERTTVEEVKICSFLHIL